MCYNVVMIAFIKGTIYSINPDFITIDVYGIGYKVYFNHPEKVHLNEPVFLYTYHLIREDDHNLYGFLESKELDLFEKLISVKGLGCKTANGMLTYSSYDRLVMAIEQADVAALKQNPGIGAKTASQIILDLKGKLVSVANKEVGINDKIKDALELETEDYMRQALQLLARKGK
ncbi:MAG: Holliday junction DNA helicase subunit RuvA [Erysipelotrichaceae bacterium]|nr:MAG: Holliday junction DNA helicase subunit RuvA [Erysipelotrichaceae bacterium]